MDWNFIVIFFAVLTIPSFLYALRNGLGMKYNGCVHFCTLKVDVNIKAKLNFLQRAAGFLAYNPCQTSDFGLVTLP